MNPLHNAEQEWRRACDRFREAVDAMQSAEETYAAAYLKAHSPVGQVVTITTARGHQHVIKAWDAKARVALPGPRIVITRGRRIRPGGYWGPVVAIAEPKSWRLYDPETDGPLPGGGEASE